ncbi:YugN family protein [Lentibacillus sediminis]|uniref:YugN family protein n=1 Tax=Lentibacillus sediminis TaxID=1940529 RepID=UPI000C1C1934|nr:YugN family protein [Lentibacillus sediminis]
MIKLKSEIEGKRAYFGQMQKLCKPCGYTLCGSWEYDGGFYDSLLWRENGESIYVRIPFHVVEGGLDSPNALLEFGIPFVIKHVVHIGLDRDEDSLFSTGSGLVNQFQDPLDKDGQIHRKNQWEEAGEQSINQVLSYIS